MADERIAKLHAAGMTDAHDLEPEGDLASAAPTRSSSCAATRASTTCPRIRKCRRRVLKPAWRAAAVAAGVLLAGALVAFASRASIACVARQETMPRLSAGWNESQSVCSARARGDCARSRTRGRCLTRLKPCYCLHASYRLNDPTYYDLPLLKPPVWTWEVPAYFFVGGAAGAAAVLGAAAQLAGGDEKLVRDARWIAPSAPALSAPLLISDLGRPERFLNMLRVFKPQSPMSVGAWTLAVFGGRVAGGGARCRASRCATSRAVAAAATGLVMATYTGVLLGATAIPVWKEHARLSAGALRRVRARLRGRRCSNCAATATHCA